MKVNLEGKVALVTGAGGRIGREIALQFARNGAELVINDINEMNGEKVVQEIIGMGKKAIYINADTSDSKQTKDMSKQAIDYFGKIDILVNNAGINVGLDGRKPLHEFSDDNWHKIININLTGVYYCSKPIITHMVERKSGVIINIGSVAGVVPLRMQSAYVATKAGLHGLTQSMALELGTFGIRVNAIAPGSIALDENKSDFFSDKLKSESHLSHIPLKRIGDPADVANAALFLAADEANYVTGSIMIVDGGWTCGYTREW